MPSTPHDVPPARHLGGALEPVVGQVYFSPECHRAYVALGFDASPAAIRGVAMPDGVAYFTSRGSLLGQVPGEVVAAAFAVFKPAIVVPAVTTGWTITDADSIRGARDQGALAQLSRVLGEQPDGLDRAGEILARAADAVTLAGRPLAAGCRALPVPDHPFGAVFRAGDVLREARGDSHTASWTSAGLDAVEIGLLTELYWGLPLRSYSRTRGWSEEDYDHGVERLHARGLVADGAFTDAGRELRERIETDTDRQMTPVLAAIGDDVEELLRLLGAWAAQLRGAHAYPASGPHDLASAAAR